MSFGDKESKDTKPETAADREKMNKLLRTCATGEFFTKYAYASRSKPSQKLVFYQARVADANKTDDEIMAQNIWDVPVSVETAICWSDVNMNKRVFDANRCIYLLNITDVYLGQQTPAFDKRKQVSSPIQDDRCLSIQGKARTLDLVAPNKQQRDRWAEGIIGLLKRTGKPFNLRTVAAETVEARKLSVEKQ